MSTYRSVQMFVSEQSHPDLFAYLLTNAKLAKNLYNASLFRLRQVFTAQNKETLTENELEIQTEQLAVCKKHGLEPLTLLSYNRLELMMREFWNPDFLLVFRCNARNHV